VTAVDLEAIKVAEMLGKKQFKIEKKWETYFVAEICKIFMIMPGNEESRGFIPNRMRSKELDASVLLRNSYGCVNC